MLTQAGRQISRQVAPEEGQKFLFMSEQSLGTCLCPFPVNAGTKHHGRKVFAGHVTIPNFAYSISVTSQRPISLASQWSSLVLILNLREQDVAELAALNLLHCQEIQWLWAPQCQKDGDKLYHVQRRASKMAGEKSGNQAP